MGGISTSTTKADYDRLIESKKASIAYHQKQIAMYRENAKNTNNNNKIPIQTHKDYIARDKAELAALKEKRKNAPK